MFTWGCNVLSSTKSVRVDCNWPMSKHRLVCKNAISLAHYWNSRLLVMGSWRYPWRNAQKIFYRFLDGYWDYQNVILFANFHYFRCVPEKMQNMGFPIMKTLPLLPEKLQTSRKAWYGVLNKLIPIFTTWLSYFRGQISHQNQMTLLFTGSIFLPCALAKNPVRLYCRFMAF